MCRLLIGFLMAMLAGHIALAQAPPPVTMFGRTGNNVLSITPGVTPGDAVRFSVTGPGGIQLGAGAELNLSNKGYNLQLLNGAPSGPPNALPSACDAGSTCMTLGQPTMSISREQNMTIDTLCGGNSNTVSCNSALTMWVDAPSTDKFIASGLAVRANSAQLATAAGSQPGTQASGAAFLRADVSGQSPGRAIATYIVGTKNSTAPTSSAWGLEVGSWNLNDPGTNGCSLNPRGDKNASNQLINGPCVGITVNSRVGYGGNTASPQPNSAAMVVQSSDFGATSYWQNGIYVDTGAVGGGGVTFDDEAINSTGKSLVLGGQKRVGIDFSTGTFGADYMIALDFSINTLPQMTIGTFAQYDPGAAFGANYGLEMLSSNTTPGNTSSILFGHWSPDALGSSLTAYKSRGAGNTTSRAAVQAGDVIQDWQAFGDDGAAEARSSGVRHQVGSTVGAGIVSGDIRFFTASTTGVFTQALEINDAQSVLGNAFALLQNPTFVVGQQGKAPTGAVYAANHGLQLISSAASLGTTSNELHAQFSASATPPISYYYKSRSPAVSGHAVLLNGDIMLSIQAIGDDGVTDRSAAAIDVFASNTPAAGHVPGTFRVRTANTSGALVAGLTIDDTQKATLSGPVTLSGLGATPGGKQPVCIDTATGVLYKANAGAC